MKATHLYCVGCLHHCRTKNDVRAFMRTGNCVRCTRIFKRVLRRHDPARDVGQSDCGGVAMTDDKPLDLATLAKEGR